MVKAERSGGGHNESTKLKERKRGQRQKGEL